MLGGSGAHGGGQPGGDVGEPHSQRPGTTEPRGGPRPALALGTRSLSHGRQRGVSVAGPPPRQQQRPGGTGSTQECGTSRGGPGAGAVPPGGAGAVPPSGAAAAWPGHEAGWGWQSQGQSPSAAHPGQPRFWARGHAHGEGCSTRLLAAPRSLGPRGQQHRVAELWPIPGSHGREREARGSSGTVMGTQARTGAQAEPLSPRSLQLPALRPHCPTEVWGWWPLSLLGQAQSPDTDAGCGAVDHVQSQDVPREPAIVPGGRTMPGELPGHHGPLHTAWPGSHLQLPRSGVPPALAVPPALSCPPATLTAVPVPVGAVGAAARLGSAQHSTAPGAAQSPLPSTGGTQLRRGPSSEPRPAAPAQEGGDGGVTLRWSWGRDGVTGTNLRPGEDLKPCLHLAAAWRCQPRAPCGCCRCSCSWGSAASGPGWWLQVSGGQVRGGCPRRGLSAAVPPCVTPNLTAQQARALQGPGMPQGWDTPASPQVSPRSHLDPP